MNNRFNSLIAPLGIELAYLRANSTTSHVRLKRLRSSVSAKQNGFWQIIS
ncbi:hypothetical protein [Pseudomonas sp. R5(2019)]|nr:hypothetical protein [Pseudomonas sp. R5(2019)]